VSYQWVWLGEWIIAGIIAD